MKRLKSEGRNSESVRGLDKRRRVKEDGVIEDEERGIKGEGCGFVGLPSEQEGSWKVVCKEAKGQGGVGHDCWSEKKNRGQNTWGQSCTSWTVG